MVLQNIFKTKLKLKLYFFSEFLRAVFTLKAHITQKKPRPFAFSKMNITIYKETCKTLFVWAKVRKIYFILQFSMLDLNGLKIFMLNFIIS